MARTVQLEIPADNPQRALDFYSKLYGWKFSKWDGPMDYRLINTGDAAEPGIKGGLMPRRDPNQPCVNTIGVTNLDESVATVVEMGGAIALPKMPVPGVGWLAYCKDTDGHIFGMMQPDTAAA
jgi:predicted enzyme related to lactoylglutathione lyase